MNSRKPGFVIYSLAATAAAFLFTANATSAQDPGGPGGPPGFGGQQGGPGGFGGPQGGQGGFRGPGGQGFGGMMPLVNGTNSGGDLSSGIITIQSQFGSGRTV